jgi:hypothetical protein
MKAERSQGSGDPQFKAVGDCRQQRLAFLDKRGVRIIFDDGEQQTTDLKEQEGRSALRGYAALEDGECLQAIGSPERVMVSGRVEPESALNSTNGLAKDRHRGIRQRFFARTKKSFR